MLAFCQVDHVRLKKFAADILEDRHHFHFKLQYVKILPCFMVDCLVYSLHAAVYSCHQSDDDCILSDVDIHNSSCSIIHTDTCFILVQSTYYSSSTNSQYSQCSTWGLLQRHLECKNQFGLVALNVFRSWHRTLKPLHRHNYLFNWK